jgi:hypothetical protein
MERYFTLNMPATRFAWNTLIASLLGLVPLLIIYVTLTPGFFSHLSGNTLAMSQFVRQVLTNGIPVVFVINYAGFALLAWTIEMQNLGERPSALIILSDLAIRLFLFIVLHAFIYVVSADWFGSFGGSRLTALGVVAPTLARSAFFENISGVYLYSTLVSALPLYVQVLHASPRTWPAHFSKTKVGALVTAILLFGLFALIVTLTAKLIILFQAG